MDHEEVFWSAARRCTNSVAGLVEERGYPARRSGQRMPLTEAFGPTAAHMLFDFSEIDGLAALKGWVGQIKQLRLKFELPSLDDFDTYYIPDHEVGMIPLVFWDFIHDKCEGELTDEAWSRVVSTFRNYLLSAPFELTGEVAVPILGATFAGSSEARPDRPIEIVSIEDYDDWITLTSDSLTEPDRDIAGKATHALMINRAHLYVEGFGYTFHMRPAPATHDLVDNFFEVLSAYCPGSATHVQLCVRAGADWTGTVPIRDPATEVVPVRDSPARLDSVKRMTSYESYSIDSTTREEILKGVTRLSSCHPSVGVAARRLALSRIRTTDEDMIIDLCIGLEALLGSGHTEVVHRISMRGAALLTKLGFYDSQANYKALKDIYEYRSRVVHGSPGPHKKDLLEVGGQPVHATRFALAALSALVKYAIHAPQFSPDRLDQELIFDVLDEALIGTTE